MTTITIGEANWSEYELSILRKGMEAYPRNQFSNVMIYVKIAAMLPKKCVREVVYKIHSLSNPEFESGKMIENQKKRKTDSVQYNQEMSPPPTGSLLISNYEDQIQAKFNDNNMVINKIRENLLTVQLNSNLELMAQFEQNCEAISKIMSLLNLPMPPLPVRINNSFITSNNSIDRFPSVDMHPDIVRQERV